MNYILIWLLSVAFCKAQLHNTPPVLVVVPRRWDIAIDTQVGQVVARVKVNDREGDVVSFKIEPSGQQIGLLSLKDASAFFTIHNRNNEGIVRLSQPLTKEFNVKDQLTLSITAMDNVSKVTSRAEVYIVVDESHSPLPVLNEREPYIPAPTAGLYPTLTGGSSPSNISSSSPRTKDSSEQSTDKPPMTPEEMTQVKTTVIVMVVVPILIVFPAAGVILYVYRHKINRARKKCCSCILRSSSDKDGAKVEDANGEFSHELQIKASENVYVVDGSNWVKARIQIQN